MADLTTRDPAELLGFARDYAGRVVAMSQGGTGEARTGRLRYTRAGEVLVGRRWVDAERGVSLRLLRGATTLTGVDGAGARDARHRIVRELVWGGGEPTHAERRRRSLVDRGHPKATLELTLQADNWWAQGPVVLRDNGLMVCPSCSPFRDHPAGALGRLEDAVRRFLAHTGLPACAVTARRVGGASWGGPPRWVPPAIDLEAPPREYPLYVNGYEGAA